MDLTYLPSQKYTQTDCTRDIPFVGRITELARHVQGCVPDDVIRENKAWSKRTQSQLYQI